MSDSVKFHAVINEPLPQAAAPPLAAAPKDASCCPVMPPPSDLDTILPTILVGIGVAYLFGLITGHVISNSSVE